MEIAQVKQEGPKKPRFATADDQERGFDVPIIDDEGDEIDFYITVVGVDSPTYKAKSTELQRARMNQMFRKKSAMEPEDAEKDALDLLVAATRGWRGAASPLGDEPLEFSAGNARRLYRERPQIREQVDRAINNRANFLPRSVRS